MKVRGGLLLFAFIFSVFLIGTIAAEHEGVVHETEETFEINESSGFGSGLLDEAIGEHENAVFDTDPGLTPDSFFYFIDEIFDRCSVENKDEKIAEIEAMIKSGNADAAREAFDKYRECSVELEEEIAPDERDSARESAASIAGIADELGEFREEILDNEESLLTSVEIASKIKELCETLSDLDPVAYAQTCRTDEGSPRWHKNLDEDLTKQQREEAEAFFGIMTQCFEDPRECQCEKISVTAFAEKCEELVPLAIACDVEENEEACNLMDEKTDDIEDLLPDYLLDVLHDIEDQFDDAQFEKYAPPECVEAGATTRDECEEIMFNLYAPPECVEAGLTGERECGKFMFSLRAPPECVEAGLTGEHRSDREKCEKIMRSFERDHGDRDFRGYGADCSRIQDSSERLACYDGALGRGGDDFHERYEDTREAERQCAQSCSAEGGAWDFSGGTCECYVPEFDFEFYDDSAPESSEGFDNEPLYDCSLLDCQEGYYCDPYGGCIPFEDEFAPEEESTTEPSSEPAPEEESTTEPSSEGTITGNAFLEYYFN